MGWLALFLLCLVVATASYLFGRHALSAYTGRQTQGQEPQPPQPPTPPAPAEPAAPRISIIPKEPSNQSSRESEGQGKAHAEAETTTSSYVVQVGAFTTRERAQGVARRLIEKGYPAKVVAGEAEGQVAYVVHAAASNDQVSAQRDLDSLRKDYPDAFLKRLDGQGQ